MSDRIVAAAPRVSVIMPTFKQARFLRRAIDSLCIQSLTDWELIVVDDGSPDDTQAILAPFLANPRTRSIRFDTNQGLGRALNGRACLVDCGICETGHGVSSRTGFG